MRLSQTFQIGERVMYVDTEYTSIKLGSVGEVRKYYPESDVYAIYFYDYPDRLRNLYGNRVQRLGGPW